MYEPGVLGGDGTENRVNIALKCQEEVLQQITAMENALGEHHSCVKDGILRSKITLDKIRIYDTDKELIEKIPSLVGWRINAIIKVKGKWETKKQRGLCLECTDMQLLAQDSIECPF